MPRLSLNAMMSMSNALGMISSPFNSRQSSEEPEELEEEEELAADPALDGLGNQVYLEKIDKLRDIGIEVPLPQIVVVGDQSSGKSSLLESLSGFSFPKSVGLCTRYATQITMRRSAQANIVITITPRADADADHRERIRAFRRESRNFEPADLADVMKEAGRVMGIRSFDEGEEEVGEDEEVEEEGDDTSTVLGTKTFSEDILKIEINGPDQSHLTIIDVPGLFHNTDPGITTEADKQLVKDMVRKYMDNPRTIILAVLACHVDLANQGVIDFAKEADPEGQRTMGVLTKADLVTEQALRKRVVDMVLGRRNPLKLGYCIVRNRGADEQSYSIRQYQALEARLFARAEWSPLRMSGRVGIESLRERLRELLMNVSKSEFPNVKAEISSKLLQARQTLENMGPARSEPAAQRSYLGQQISKFERIATDAAETRYVDDILAARKDLHLATNIVSLSDAYAAEMWQKGHSWHFDPAPGYNLPIRDAEVSSRPAPRRTRIFPELQNIIDVDDSAVGLPEDGIDAHIEEIYHSMRGAELGTYSPYILEAAFRKQSSKWAAITLAHVEKAIATVHEFIVLALKRIFPEERVRATLWEDFLLDALLKSYRAAADQARFLVNIELQARLITDKTTFDSKLHVAKAARHNANTQELASRVQVLPQGNAVAQWIGQLLPGRGDKQNVSDIKDALQTYYRTACKRLIDAVAQQVVWHSLIDDATSAIKVLRSELVMGMSDSQLDAVAGEDAATRGQRELLAAQIQSLEDAMAVLRT